MRNIPGIIFAIAVAGICLAGCTSKKDNPGSEPRYKISERRWDSPWSVTSSVSMWQTYSSDTGPQSIHSGSQTELLLTPVGRDPNGNTTVAVSFRRMRVADNQVTADSKDTLTAVEEALPDEDVSPDKPTVRTGLIKVLKEVCKTTVVCNVSADGQVQYISGDDLEARAGGTIKALGSLGLHFQDQFCVRTALETLKGYNHILPAEPVGKGARWHTTTYELSANTRRLKCDVAARLKNINNTDGRNTAIIVFSSKADQNIAPDTGKDRAMSRIVSRQFDVSGELEFDLGKNVARRSTVTERGKIIAEVDGERRLKRFTRDVTTTFTEAVDQK